MNRLLLAHLMFVGLWLGCVLTEVLFERALLGKGRAFEVALAGLHRRVDLFVEVPAFVGVLVSGTFLFAQTTADILLHGKIAFGLLAVVTNVYCVWLVLRRAEAATTERWDEFVRLDRLQHIYGAVVLISILAAFGIGLYRG